MKEKRTFIIVSGLIRECIIGIELLYNGGCVLDLAKRLINITAKNQHRKGTTTAEILNINIAEVRDPEIEQLIQEKIEEIRQLTVERGVII